VRDVSLFFVLSTTFRGFAGNKVEMNIIKRQDLDRQIRIKRRKHNTMIGLYKKYTLQQQLTSLAFFSHAEQKQPKQNLQICTRDGDEKEAM
jgi:hypothetical protein